MSSSVPFDTLKFVETLEAGRQELTRKGDLRETELRLDAKIETAVRDLKIWLGSIMVVAVGVILTAIR
ncbi:MULTISPECIES: hypothetical protein [Methylosinus]|uniref:DUF1640 domain-containing protein n=1 Tax=Methylosinus trichosporium (strain ATCC 35070 / NCIMB 11131 / UNIQEM 75 / OB3b) TaxID=595536 RepID=A0A2D2CVC9_METT3|nr:MULTISPECIES: hypothetical protein [Methylosinus]ATQ66687.1 DUF1640 domain-containing protein [Methylosinus trichosporium OB3b]OBS53357.1 hypothetical protein A8B73_06145 [Methylosinus sp. 3S-1]